ncbi:MAG: hypothetical protein ACXWZB_08595 [Gaiellaceae bacterium]
MTRARWAGLAGLTAALALYTAGADRLWDADLWPDLLFLTLVLFPVTFALIWLLLPLREHPAMLPAGLTLAALAVLLHFTELDVLNNLAKLFALVCLGMWFLSWFENVMWAALIAVVIPWVDAVSVWRGPTDYVVEQQPEIFNSVSIAFRVPGEDSTANLGPPDILFFSLFLAAAHRFGLRVAWTWAAMTALLGGTLILTATTDVSGLPALPAICIGFLLPNADLLWTALRRRGRAPARIYGRTDARMFDLDADVIERTPSKVVLLTRDQPPLTATVEPVEPGAAFTVEPEPGGAGLLCRLTLAGADEGTVRVHDLANGLVIVPQDEVSAYLDVVHPEQLAADEDRIERLKKERR